MEKPEDWECSSARHNLGLTTDPIIASNDLLPELIDDWQVYLTITATESESFQLKRHERTGRPLGDTGFVEQLEQTLNCTLKPQKRGPKGPWKYKKKKGDIN